MDLTEMKQWADTHPLDGITYARVQQLLTECDRLVVLRAGIARVAAGLVVLSAQQ